MSRQVGFWHLVWRSLQAIVRDRGVVLILLIAPILYGLYYPWPYASQLTRNLPVAVVDEARDGLSRRLVLMLQASPVLALEQSLSADEAVGALQRGEVLAILLIPHDLQQRVLAGESVRLPMQGHGGYVLGGKNAQQAMAEAIGTLSAGIELQQLARMGLGRATMEAVREPLGLAVQTLGNVNEGYGQYVVSAVAWLILQQTLLMAAAMMVATWAERGQAFAGVRVWLARLVSLAGLHAVVCLGYTGWMFVFWGYARGGNGWGNAVLIALFSPCVAALGCLFGLWFKDRERTMQWLIFSALPMFFVSGFSWPVAQLPWVLQWLRWGLPSTAAIHAGVGLNQLGGSVSDYGRYFVVLLGLLVGFVGMLLWVGRVRKR